MATLYNRSYLKRRIWLLFFLQILMFQIAFGQNWTNYEETTAVKVPGISTDYQISNLTSSQKSTTRQYFDGLGRAVQTIAVQASPAGKDIIQPVVYDNLGSQTTGYLPYTGSDGSASFRATAVADQATFYTNSQGGKIATDISPFSQQVFENSPLHRLLKAGSVGDGFQPTQHYKVISYRPNTSTDAVRIYLPAGTSSATYAANLLSVTQATDEQGVTSLTFTDLQGKTILTRKLISETINGTAETKLDTYYIYNDDGTVAYIVPPNAVVTMRNAGNWTVTQSALNTLIYKYVYDSQSRLVQKTVPGGSTIYMVYDPLNRPVLMQDGNMRVNNQWNYVKYDAANRTVSQGVFTDATHTTLSAMQTYVSGLDYSVNYFESRNATVINNGNYTNNCFPATNITPLAYAYYDDYDLNLNGSADYAYVPTGLSLTGEGTQTTLTRGMLTVISKTTVGAGLTGKWLTTAVFYDKYGHVIQTRGNNHTNTATTFTDTKTIAPDFTGKPLWDYTVKSLHSTSATVLSTYTYDPAGRIKAVDQSYNGAATIRIGAYTYNELGQLVYKQLHSKDAGSTFMQSVDYRYNIRGKLLTINNSTLTAGGNNTAGTGAVFGMEFLYDKVDGAAHPLNNTPYYNGLLSAVKWMAQTSTLTERSYTFTYDDQNRLKDANYADRPQGNGVWANATAYDEKGITYDYTGNITTLQRNAIVSSTIQPVDNLQYTYSNNRLNTVTDGTGASYTGLGFKNPNAVITPYAYDTNGNLTADSYKGLTLQYNVLNKTDKITVVAGTGQYIDYTYDAGGKLIRKQQYNNGTVKTTDYVDGFVLVNNNLSYFGMPEGRVVSISGTLKPEYFVSDQQGNVRLSFIELNNTGTSQVRQENSYYPFGLIMPNSQVATPASAANKQLYNGGSEWQNDYGDLPDYYQTFYRNYDAALGRFVGVDPHASTYASLNPYQYAGNNPLMFNDPSGADQVLPDNWGPSIAFPPSPRSTSLYTDGPGEERRQSVENSVYDIGGAHDPTQIGNDQLLQMALDGNAQALTMYATRMGGVTYNSDYIDAHPEEFYHADHTEYFNPTTQESVFDEKLGDRGNMYWVWTFNPIGGNNANQGGWGHGSGLWGPIADWVSKHFYYEAGVKVTQGSLGGSFAKFFGYEFNLNKRTIYNLSSSTDHKLSLTGDNGERLTGGKGVIPTDVGPIGVEANFNQNGELQSSFGIGDFGFEHSPGQNGNFAGADATEGVGLGLIGLEMTLKAGFRW